MTNSTVFELLKNSKNQPQNSGSMKVSTNTSNNSINRKHLFELQPHIALHQEILSEGAFSKK